MAVPGVLWHVTDPHVDDVDYLTTTRPWAIVRSSIFVRIARSKSFLFTRVSSFAITCGSSSHLHSCHSVKHRSCRGERSVSEGRQEEYQQCLGIFRNFRQCVACKLHEARGTFVLRSLDFLSTQFDEMYLSWH